MIRTPYLQYCLQHMPSARFDFASSQVPFRDPGSIRVPREVLALRPSAAIARAREAIAAQYGIDVEHAMVGHGATGAAAAFFSTLTDDGAGTIAVEAPGYEGLVSTAKAWNHQVRRFTRYPVLPDPADVAPNARCVVITNPHNPTGAVLPHDWMQDLADACDLRGALLLVDESFLWFTTDPLARTAANLRPNVYVVSSLSKAHGLAQIRLGWLIGEPRRLHEASIRMMATIGIPCALSCGYGSAFISNGLELDESVLQHLASREARLRTALNETPAQWLHPDAGLFGLAKIAPLDCTKTAERLRRETGILSIPGTLFHAPGHLRLSFGCYNPHFEESLGRLCAHLREAAS